MIYLTFYCLSPMEDTEVAHRLKLELVPWKNAVYCLAAPFPIHLASLSSPGAHPRASSSTKGLSPPLSVSNKENAPQTYLSASIIDF